MGDSGGRPAAPSANGGSSAGGSGPTVNGCLDGALTPELLFKMNKKIAQLTKVVYGLNTRGEELECQLTAAKQAEEAMRERASLYKSKLDCEGGGGGGEAHFYKMECDTLKRRLDELTYGGLGMAAMREDLELCRRREKALQYELDQARHAITNMKSHHDFMMRERDSQVSLEAEKTKLEWQARLNELESRYKVQMRHLTEDCDAARAECDALRRRAVAATDEAQFKDQLAAIAFDREREGRDWQLKLQLKEHELDEERIRHGQEKRERDHKIRALNEERRREEERWEERIRSTTKSFEERLREAEDKRDLLTRLLSEKEAEFETRLKSKVAEWKVQWDAVEDNLQAEIISLKSENALLQSSQAIENESKIQELKDELQQKAADYDLLARNLKMRINVAETEARNLSLETKNYEKHLKDEKERNKQNQHRTELQIEALERHLKEEVERHKFTQAKCDSLGAKIKGELEQRLKQLQLTETQLKDENARLLAEVESLKAEAESFGRTLREKEKEYQQRLEKEVKAAEGKVKARVEKSWVEKLKKTEESAAQDMERAREGHRRVEGDLKKEILLLQKAEVEARRLNEEFKKKVRQLRQSENELQARLTQTEESAQRIERSLSRSASRVSVSRSGSTVFKNNESNDENESEETSSAEHRKELSSLEAKYKDQVDQLTKALALKQEELKKSKEEAEKILKQSEERSKREQEELKEKLEKDKAEIEERHRKEQEEREQREHEAAKLQNDTKEADEKSSSPTHEEEDKDEEEEEESEAECNKRKLSSLQTEILLLKQQNDEFEAMVREKHRRQIELELQIVEMGRDVTAKEATAESVKVELCYSKNEQELMRARTKRMEEEITELKERIESLEQELDTSERELKRMEILQEKLQITEAKRNELQTQLDEVEVERDEEIKIIQDALDEAAQEREELLITFEKEIENLNSLNAAREAQMLEDFEAKLKELEQQHKAKLEERERLSEAPLHRGKRQPDEEETRQRLDKMKSELNSEWEDKLRSECSRLKGELDNLHAEEKHLAVESIKVQKEQELQNLKKTFETKAEDMNKEIATLKESLATKDAFYHKELDDMRTRADRDIWELRRKLQKLDESSYDRQQYLEDKHRDDIERLREDYVDKMASMESQLSVLDVRGMVDMRAQLEKIHKEQMEHIGEQHTLSMERLRDELEAEKFQAAEEARVIVTKHHEYINNTLREQLTEALTANTQYRDEIEAIRFALSRREEVIRSLEEDLAKLRSSKGVTPPNAGFSSSPTSIGGATGGGGVSPPSSTSQFFHEGSQGSRSSQDRLSTEGPDEEGHKGSGLLGKVFGGGWFSGPKTKDNTSPGYSNTTGTAATRRGSSSLYKQAW